MPIDYNKAPFPWFGGKSKAAPAVWDALGDVPHYVEPFYGSGAVLLNRPHPCNRAYYSETVNDKDGFVVNFWRAIQWAPEATAHAASWLYTEADKQARQIALLRWMDNAVDRLAGDAGYYDPVIAGWWAYAVCAQIGAFDGKQGWTADPVTGKIYLQPRGKTREFGAQNNGEQRDPVVDGTRCHLSNNGMGVNHAGLREPGVRRNRSHLTGCMGVNIGGLREPGVLDPITPEHGVSALDSIDWGQAFHDQTMPELVRWFRYLAARLRHVRVINGDWSRVVTTGAAWTLPVRQGKGPCGVFLDPPYADTAGRNGNLYAADSMSVAHDVREWCLANGDNPKFRIVLAGFQREHGDAFERAGWREIEWYKAGHLTGGMGNTKKTKANGTGHQQHRERLWISPYCIGGTASGETQDTREPEVIESHEDELFRLMPSDIRLPDPISA